MTGAASITRTRREKRWLAVSLKLAGLYNLLFGGLAIVLPNLWFDLAGMTRPTYPELWQCVGMIVGVYGIGYLIAARDIPRHWPIVLVGLLGKVFGPIGFALAVARGTFPVAAGWVIVTNDIVWWVPFTAALVHAHHANREGD